MAYINFNEGQDPPTKHTHTQKKTKKKTKHQNNILKEQQRIEKETN